MSAQHCPTCRAVVRPGAPWCPLCHLDLRPAVQPVAGTVGQRAVAVTGGSQGHGRHALVCGWPCLACNTLNELEAATCVTCGSGFLAELHADPVAPLRLPVVGELSKLSRAARTGIAVGAGLLCAVVLSGLLAAAGAVL